MGDSARPVIEAALADNGVEALMGMGVTAVDAHGVTLSSGEVVPAATVVWCAGMRANPLTAQLPVDARPARPAAGRRLSAGGRACPTCSPPAMSPRRGWTTSTCR